MKSRAERLHQNSRALQRARRHLKRQRWFDTKPTEEEILRTARKIRDHKTVCSCPMCRNARHSPLFKRKERLTLQEIRSQLPEIE